jgi:hypothetical protein
MTTVHEPVTPPLPAASPTGEPVGDAAQDVAGGAVGKRSGEVASPDRSRRLADAAKQWAAELAALTGRDPLVHYRDLKVGTLDLAAADPDNRKRLLDGEPVPLSRLFPHEPLRSSALRSARSIRDGSRELADEHGIDVCHLAVGIATWANPYSAHRPTAPVLLRQATVTARDPAETDFVLQVATDAEVNPVLLDAMDSQLGLRLSADDLCDADGTLRYLSAVERLRDFAPAHVVDGFSIAHRAILGRFAREPLMMAADVGAFAGEFEEHDVVAALAGDAQAARAMRSAAGPARRPSQLAFDADAAQRDVVAAISSGRHLRVQAPPGTGRTQTVANAVAELVALGQRVLVVGNKRASLRDLTDRLDAAGLGDVVLDCTEAARTAVDGVIAAAQRLSKQELPDESAPGSTTPSGGSVASTAPRSDGSGAASVQADDAGERVRYYLEALHRRRDPWGTSAYQAMAAVSAADPPTRTTTRLPEDTLQRLGVGSIEAMRVKLREYAELGGLTAKPQDSVWDGATVPTADIARGVSEAIAALRTSTLPALRDTATRAAVEVGLAGPATPAEALATVDLLTAVSDSLHVFGPQLWDAPLDEFVAATADRRWRVAHGHRLGLVARRRLRLQVLDLLADPATPIDRSQLHARLRAAREQLTTWRARARDGRPPRSGEHLPAAIASAAAVRQQLGELVAAHPAVGDLGELAFGDVARRLAELGTAEDYLLALPRLNQLHAELLEAGLGDLVAELRESTVPAADVPGALTYTWQASLLNLWRRQDPALGQADPAELEASLASSAAGGEPAVGAVARVLAGRARRFAEIAAELEGQATVVVEWTSPDRSGGRPTTLRELVGAAPEVSLAAKPCWVTSPLSVPTVLPARRLFDVVIVEDAGLLPPAHSVPALARGGRVVLVGDAEQLPTAGFVSAADQTAEPDDDGPRSSAEPLPSVLASLADALPTLPLITQYRVRDHRLLGYAAATTYRGRLAMLPAASAPPGLRHELVEPDDDGTDSSEAEVRRVVELVCEHARTRAHESLAVVTLSRPHAARVESAIRTALVRNPDVASFLAEDRAEPFFVKDVTRVAGDVRDAIILSVGFGRSVDGRVLYRFGGLDRPGGEQRLAAAITRSRERTVVVSCFGADDLSPRRLTTAGGQALRDFLAYAAGVGQPERSGAPAHDQVAGVGQPERTGAPVHDQAGGVGQPEAERDRTPAPDDPLTGVIAARLAEAGASVVVNYGEASAPIEIAVRHPKRRDRFVLAIETDRDQHATDPGSVRYHGGRRRERLKRLGWSVHRVWSAAWAADPDREAARLIEAYERAAVDADAYDWAVAAVEADVVAGLPDDAGHADDEGKATSGGKKHKRGKARRNGTRPAVPKNRAITSYSRRELAAVARWLESDGVSRSESAVVELLAKDVAPRRGLSPSTERLPERSGAHAPARRLAACAYTDDVLRHAARLARAGAPGL